MTFAAWDADCEQELADIDAEIRRAWSVEPVTMDAAVRLRERIGRLEKIARRLRARKEAAS